MGIHVSFLECRISKIISSRLLHSKDLAWWLTSPNFKKVQNTPWKINMEPKNGGLKDDSPFQLGDFLGFHVSCQGCNFNAFQSQSGSVPPPTSPRRGGRKNCRPGTFYSKRTFTFTIIFQILILHYPTKNRKKSTLNLNKKQNMTHPWPTSHFETPSPPIYPTESIGDGNLAAASRDLLGDWYLPFEAACLSRPVVALPRSCMGFGWLRKLGKVAKTWTYPVGW